MQQLGIDTAAVQVLATRWAVSVDGLGGTAPVRAGLSGQASAAAVNAAHVDITAFTAALAARVNHHAAHVGAADAGYLANEAAAVAQMTAMAVK
ncbi:MAG: hypothetical protein PHQ28_12195 [Mycobacterium sp.]|nr:hypothetical protein [Mycobacterium sp.]